MLKNIVTLGLLCLSCAGEDTSHVSVEPNDLGVKSIQVERYFDHADAVFELRGLDADDHQVALVRVRTGTIDGLPGVVEDDDHLGSEITTDVLGDKTTTVTRETALIQLSVDSQTRQFFAIPAVASVLAAEAHLVAASSPELVDEVPLTTQTCPSNLVMGSAYACCYSGSSTTSAKAYWNVTAPTQSVVTRSQNPNHTGCRASNGTSTCSGSLCYYGPLGFTRSNITSNINNYYLIIQLTNCSYGWGPSTPGPGPQPGNVSGTGGTDCGCCKNQTGPCCGTTACTACGGAGGGAGIGVWNM